MAKKKRSKGAGFVIWGLSLCAFPAVAGTLFATGFGAFEYIPVAIALSYVLWGWVTVIIGLMLLIVGAVSMVVTANSKIVEKFARGKDVKKTADELVLMLSGVSVLLAGIPFYIWATEKGFFDMSFMSTYDQVMSYASVGVLAIGFCMFFGGFLSQVLRKN